MAWYNGTYSCGHEGRTNIIGPVKNREWIRERHFEKMCADCYEIHLQKEREKANKEAAEKAIEMELPALQGTEKQVAWANTLRQNMINDFEKRLDKAEEKMTRYKCEDESSVKAFRDNVDKLRNTLAFVLETKCSASWYIDSRNEDIEDVLRTAGKEMDELEESKRPEVREAKQEQADIRRDSTVYPENSITNAVVEIKVTTDKITAVFEKNERFREIVKSLGYKWECAWERNINELTGSAEDRAAELGNKLLNAGFPILILDNNIRQNAIDGNYEKECNRWIRTTKDGRLAIRWWEDNDRLYRTARSLPGSKWEDKYVVVSVAHYKEVEDFAQLQGFKFTKKAQELIETEKNKTRTIVTPSKVEIQDSVDGLKEILNSSEEILDDLKD
jgi:hypothetical protein